MHACRCHGPGFAAGQTAEAKSSDVIVTLTTASCCGASHRARPALGDRAHRPVAPQCRDR
jgi:hypothetical protein